MLLQLEIVLKHRYPAEPVRCTSPLFRRRDCSPNAMFSIVSAPACQKRYIFQLNFNNSYLRSISSICLTVALAMRFLWSSAHADFELSNVMHFSNEFAISRFAIMWPSELLLSPLVSGTFRFVSISCSIITTRRHHLWLCSLIFLVKSQCFCNVFM